MKKSPEKLDPDTLSLLTSIAEANDDPKVIAELANVDPNELRKFLETSQIMSDEAHRLLDAAEASADESASMIEGVARYGTDRPSRSLTGFTDPAVFADQIMPFSLVFGLYLAMMASLGYGLSGTAVISYLSAKVEAQSFWNAYVRDFHTMFSVGLVFGAALIVFRTQTKVSEKIEVVLKGYLPSNYYFYKRRFLNSLRSLTFSAEMVVIAFVIFSFCRFPLAAPGRTLMIVAACAEYALGTYVIRKLLYAAMMLYSLLTIRISGNVFRTRDLDAVDTYVRSVSILTIICVCIHVMGYYRGPFLYDSVLGTSAKIFLLLPAIVATPLLLIIHFYPRIVLQKLYARSIDEERGWLTSNLQNHDMTDFERLYYVIEFDKMSRSELRSYSQLKLTDLLLGVTVLIMLSAIVRG